MISYPQIENGLVAWLDNELLPGLPVNGRNDALKKVAVTTAALYCLKNGRKLLDGYAPMLKAVGAMDDAGNIDIDGVADILRSQVPDTGMVLNIPLIGSATFYKADVDTIKKYITKEVAQ